MWPLEVLVLPGSSGGGSGLCFLLKGEGKISLAVFRDSGWRNGRNAHGTSPGMVLVVEEREQYVFEVLV